MVTRKTSKISSSDGTERLLFYAREASRNYKISIQLISTNDHTAQRAYVAFRNMTCQSDLKNVLEFKNEANAH